MKHKKTSFYVLFFFSLSILLLVVILASLMLGSASIPPSDVMHLLFNMAQGGGSSNLTPTEQIIWSLRLPRTVLALAVGAGLAIVGVAIQALVKNPLADPYILGISSGASVGATLVILAGAFSFLGTYAVSGAAFIGALLTVIAVYLLAQERFRISVTRLLLSGIAVSMMLSAVTSFLVSTNPHKEGIQTALYWIMGSVAGATLEQLWIPIVSVAGGYIFLQSSYRSLNVLVTDDSTARSLGLNIASYRLLLIVVTALITGVLVAVSGAIGFVGLMIPHMARMIVGANHQVLLPASAMLGAIFMAAADIAARVVIAPEELPVGIITAMCGGPFFIWLLRKSNYSI
ncbi:FecCD family ABC transporter permease [Alteribacillus iranensis]|uniref:Iron complex transport system permease protein n=1 Tax=Alteribacillus iranensis TaxID=930128 RepID=A0A1I2B7M2_9BACI|nr:iron ABC transporter permease [Alteribacillus iranensis]SFE51323.1 iron complex transport system permease protein [Alteribacillus iranensis]